MNKRRVSFYVNMVWWLVVVALNPANIVLWEIMYPWTAIGEQFLAEVMYGKW